MSMIPSHDPNVKKKVLNSLDKNNPVIRNRLAILGGEIIARKLSGSIENAYLEEVKFVKTLCNGLGKRIKGKVAFSAEKAKRSIAEALMKGKPLKEFFGAGWDKILDITNIIEVHRHSAEYYLGLYIMTETLGHALAEEKLQAGILLLDVFEKADDYERLTDFSKKGREAYNTVKYRTGIQLFKEILQQDKGDLIWQTDKSKLKVKLTKYMREELDKKFPRKESSSDKQSSPLTSLPSTVLPSLPFRTSRINLSHSFETSRTSSPIDSKRERKSLQPIGPQRDTKLGSELGRFIKILKVPSLLNIVKGVRKYLKKKDAPYAPGAGIAPLKNMISLFEKEYFDRRYNSNQVFIIPGIITGLETLLKVLADKGDYIWASKPVMDKYSRIIKIVGGEIYDKGVDILNILKNKNIAWPEVVIFEISEQESISMGRLKRIIKICEEKSIAIVFLETYDDNSMRAKEIREIIGGEFRVNRNIVILTDFSQRFKKLEGWQLGWMLTINDQVYKAFLRFASQSFICTNIAAQYRILNILRRLLKKKGFSGDEQSVFSLIIKDDFNLLSKRAKNLMDNGEYVLVKKEGQAPILSKDIRNKKDVEDKRDAKDKGSSPIFQSGARQLVSRAPPWIRKILDIIFTSKLFIQSWEKSILKNNVKREKNFSKYACKSSKATRKYPEREKIPDKQNIRQAFFHDTHRIVHSLPYTRYIDKTQVFFQFNNDNITHRVLHVQLVAGVSRTIARALRLNEDLCEAISLGHDLGHVPFGHEGEDFLSALCAENNIGWFCHNAQSARLLMEVEKEGKGLNLTLQVLDGILCHNGEIIQRKYEPDYKKTWEQFHEEYKRCFLEKGYDRKIKAMTLEGCVMRISDVIAYIGRDIEDAIILGLITRDDLPKEITNVLGNTNRKIMNTLIIDLIKNSYGKPYFEFSKDIFVALKDLLEYNLKFLYLHPILRSKEQMDVIKEAFKKLFIKYCQDLRNKDEKSDIYKYLLTDKNDEYRKNTDYRRVVVDFIAGMTDSFFRDQCSKNKLPLPKLFEYYSPPKGATPIFLNTKNTSSPVKTTDSIEHQTLDNRITRFGGIEKIYERRISIPSLTPDIWEGIRLTAVNLKIDPASTEVYSLLVNFNVHFAHAPPEWTKEFGAAIGLLKKDKRILRIIILPEGTSPEIIAHVIQAALVEITHKENLELDRRKGDLKGLPEDLLMRIHKAKSGFRGNLLDRRYVAPSTIGKDNQNSEANDFLSQFIEFIETFVLEDRGLLENYLNLARLLRERFGLKVGRLTDKKFVLINNKYVIKFNKEEDYAYEKEKAFFGEGKYGPSDGQKILYANDEAKCLVFNNVLYGTARISLFDFMHSYNITLCQLEEAMRSLAEELAELHSKSPPKDTDNIYLDQSFAERRKRVLERFEYLKRVGYALRPNLPEMIDCLEQRVEDTQIVFNHGDPSPWNFFLDPWTARIGVFIDAESSSKGPRSKDLVKVVVSLIDARKNNAFLIKHCGRLLSVFFETYFSKINIEKNFMLVSLPYYFVTELLWYAEGTHRTYGNRTWVQWRLDLCNWFLKQKEFNIFKLTEFLSTKMFKTTIRWAGDLMVADHDSFAVASGRKAKTTSGQGVEFSVKINLENPPQETFLINNIAVEFWSNVHGGIWRSARGPLELVEVRGEDVFFRGSLCTNDPSGHMRPYGVTVRVSLNQGKTWKYIELPFGNSMIEVRNPESGFSFDDYWQGALNIDYYALMVDIDGTLKFYERDIPFEIYNALLTRNEQGIDIAFNTSRDHTDTVKHIVSNLERLARKKGWNIDLRKIHVYLKNGGYGYNLATGQQYYSLLMHDVSRREAWRIILEGQDIARFIYPDSYHEQSCRINFVFRGGVDRALFAQKLNERLQEINSEIPQNLVALYTNDCFGICSVEGTKLRALIDFSSRIHVPIHCIVRIGDQGQRYGIDASMLDGPGGFSVYHANQGQAYPLSTIRNLGIRNADATAWLINHLYILNKGNREGSISSASSSKKGNSDPTPFGCFLLLPVFGKKDKENFINRIKGVPGQRLAPKSGNAMCKKARNLSFEESKELGQIIQKRLKLRGVHYNGIIIQSSKDVFFQHFPGESAIQISPCVYNKPFRISPNAKDAFHYASGSNKMFVIWDRDEKYTQIGFLVFLRYRDASHLLDIKERLGRNILNTWGSNIIFYIQKDFRWGNHDSAAKNGDVVVPFVNAFTVPFIALMLQRNWEGKTVEDIGSGHGILSLVALRLGAKKVYALEKHRDVIERTKEVVENNGYSLDGQERDVIFINRTINFNNIKTLGLSEREVRNIDIVLSNTGPAYGDLIDSVIRAAGKRTHIERIMVGGYAFGPVVGIDYDIFEKLEEFGFPCGYESSLNYVFVNKKNEIMRIFTCAFSGKRNTKLELPKNTEEVLSETIGSSSLNTGVIGKKANGDTCICGDRERSPFADNSTASSSEKGNSDPTPFGCFFLLPVLGMVGDSSDFNAPSLENKTILEKIIIEAVRQNKIGLWNIFQRCKNIGMPWQMETDYTNDVSKEKRLSAKVLDEACDLAWEDLERRILFLQKQAGIKINLLMHQAKNLFGRFDHAFLVVSFEGEHFLIDTVFEEFFNKREQQEGDRGYAGYIIRRVSKRTGNNWQLLADKLRKYGYIRLTDEVANMYGCALRGEYPLDTSFKMEHFLKYSTEKTWSYPPSIIDGLMGKLEVPENIDEIISGSGVPAQNLSSKGLFYKETNEDISDLVLDDTVTNPWSGSEETTTRDEFRVLIEKAFDKGEYYKVIIFIKKMREMRGSKVPIAEFLGKEVREILEKVVKYVKQEKGLGDFKSSAFKAFKLYFGILGEKPQLLSKIVESIEVSSIRAVTYRVQKALDKLENLLRLIYESEKPEEDIEADTESNGELPLEKIDKTETLVKPSKSKDYLEKNGLLDVIQNFLTKLQCHNNFDVIIALISEIYGFGFADKDELIKLSFEDYDKLVKLVGKDSGIFYDKNDALRDLVLVLNIFVAICELKESSYETEINQLYGVKLGELKPKDLKKIVNEFLFSVDNESEICAYWFYDGREAFNVGDNNIEDFMKGVK
ncbi:MAG: aminotransferase class I/II-fold pyridoxal phosphate-dependent enzyme [Candidatus Omnitrophica bacterium]|nr:aminotransferase class I/II-fold pyridoxal phosphate-dependent enzyme [Candidatus Omnitrophota bacterium]